MYRHFKLITWPQTSLLREMMPSYMYLPHMWYTRNCCFKILIDWLVFNANFSNISAISWHLKRTQFFKNKHWNIFVEPWGQAITDDINTLQTTLHYRQDKQNLIFSFFCRQKTFAKYENDKINENHQYHVFSFFKYIQFCCWVLTPWSTLFCHFNNYCTGKLLQKKVVLN
jgi:hypothetical protein